MCGEQDAGGSCGAVHPSTPLPLYPLISSNGDESSLRKKSSLYQPSAYLPELLLVVIGSPVLRRSRAYGRVPSLHLERGRSLWLRNLKKDLSFVIVGEEVPQTVLLPRRLLRPRRSLTSIRMRRPPIRHRVPVFPFLFHRSSFP